MVADAVAFRAYQPPKLGLQTQGTKFMRKGREWRGMGVNHFALVLNQHTDMLVGGIGGGVQDVRAIAQTWGLPVIRCCFGPFDRPSCLDFRSNPSKWYGKMDEIVAECEAQGVGLIPTIVWQLRYWCDMSYVLYSTLEGPSKLAVSTSNSRALLEDTITTMVTRYRNSPAIWGWSVTNEGSAFLGPEEYVFWKPDGTHRVGLNWGTTPAGTTYLDSDKMTMLQWREFNRWATETIHRLDGYGRFVSSSAGIGNSFAVNAQSAPSYAADTLAQWDQYRDGMAWPAWRDSFCDALSAHIYPQRTDDVVFFNDAGNNLTQAQLVAQHKTWAERAGMPFALEEWGAAVGDPLVDAVSVDDATSRQAFADCLNAIVSNDVRLSLLWNYGGKMGGLPWQGFKLTDPSRTYQLEAIAAANRTMAASN